MSTFWESAGWWWVQAMTSGGAVLLLGWVAMLVCRRPAYRQRVGAWAVRGAVLAAVLSALPPWFLLPRPNWAEPAEPLPPLEVVAVSPEPPPVEFALPSAPEVGAAGEGEFEWVFVPFDAVTPAAEPTVPPPAADLPPALEPPAEPPPPAAAEASVWSSVVPLLLTAYAAVAGWLLLQLVWERVALCWLLRGSPPLIGRARWVLDQLTEGETRPRAVASERVRWPLCVGFFRPTLVLPKRMADSASESTLRWVLAHELDHLRRGDTRTAHWLGVARAVFFFLPWLWLLRKDLNLCQEYLADAAAAGTGNAPADYAAFLVDMSGGRAVRPALAAARMRAGKSDLFRRVHMLLNGKANTGGASRGFTVVAGTAAIAAAVGLAGIGFADEPKKGEVEMRVIVLEKSTADVNATRDALVEKIVQALKADKHDEAAKLMAALKKVAGEREVVEVQGVSPKNVQLFVEALEGKKPGTGKPVEVDVRVIGKEGEKSVTERKEVKVIEVGGNAKELQAHILELLKNGKADEAKKLLTVIDDKGLKFTPAKAPGGVVKVDPVWVVKPDAKKVDPVWVVKPDAKPVLPLQLRGQPADAPKAVWVAQVAADNDLREQYEKQLREFEESIKNAKDAEAREQLEKTRDEYKKAMEEPLKKADAARKELDDARKKLQNAERNNRMRQDEALQRLIEMQKEMEQRLLNDFGRFQLPLNPEDLRRLEGMPFGPGGVGGIEGLNGLFLPVRRAATQARLGVKVDKVPGVLAAQLDLPKDTGLVISDVVPNSPAAKAGLKANDVLLKIGEKEVPTDPATFTAIVNNLDAGEAVDAVVLRKGAKETVKGITLPEQRQPGRGDFGGLGGAVGGLRGGFAGNQSVQIQVNNGDVTLNATVDGVGYTVTGTVDGGKLVPAKIVVTEGKESKEYESVDKVPEGQRAALERVLGTVRLFGGR